jgi:hypothetical protein
LRAVGRSVADRSGQKLLVQLAGDIIKAHDLGYALEVAPDTAAAVDKSRGSTQLLEC